MCIRVHSWFLLCFGCGLARAECIWVCVGIVRLGRAGEHLRHGHLQIGRGPVFFNRFHFLDPGPLIDGELELVVPCARLADELLAASSHPLTCLQAPADAQVTREQIHRFLTMAPGGHESAARFTRRLPQYHFWMKLREAYRARPGSPPLSILGGISLRIGATRSLELYYGHMGYHVYPAARGRHYAERACRLLLPLARRHGIKTLWITCNPENLASRRTCERLGARLIEIVAIPEDEPLHARGDRAKCRYRMSLGD